MGHFSSGYCMVSAPVELISRRERCVTFFFGNSLPKMIDTMCRSVMAMPPTMEGRYNLSQRVRLGRGTT
jgi:hypothetical protein